MTRARLIAALAAAAVMSPAYAFDLLAARDLGELSIEELASLPITSVARRETRLDTSPASVYVITAEDIRRSGATTLPEVLRLAPNLQVARVSSVEYAITARGFNNRVGNKLLVLIDGRTVYTPVYSGVFWEMQDTMLEDIERIEVISGPGATLWGANAVNGVINVITYRADSTDGAVAVADVGSHERGAALRFGGALGATGAYRVYARGREWDRTRRADGTSPNDEWHRLQTGFRADWDVGRDRLTLQGDVFAGSSEHRGFVGPFEITEHEVSGYNVLGRWTRSLDGGGEFRVQAFWDFLHREELIVFQPEVRTLDVEFQHAIPIGAHAFMWGGGYRRADDDVEPGFFSTFIPRERTMEWTNLFAQHEVRVTPSLAATLGLKLESNPFTGTEHLPSARLAWTPLYGFMAWASASRAVRSPARYDRDVFFPQQPPHIIAGGPDFVSEVATVTELGLRARPAGSLSLSLTAFHHDWSKLRSGTPLPLPAHLANNIDGEVWGVEGWAHMQAAPRLRLSGGFLSQRKNLWFRAGTEPDTVGTDNATLHNDPEFQWMLRSRLDIGDDWELDVYLRGVGELDVEPVPAYTELDIRVGWRASPTLDVALVGRNLLQARHPEFGASATRSEVDRSAMIRAQWRF